MRNALSTQRSWLREQLHVAGANELRFVTGLRALAALYVLLSHVWYHIWPAVPPPYGYGRHPEGWAAWLTGWLYYGHFGVVVFIVLSGFCLMLPVVENGGQLRGGVRGFLLRRVKRILPPYYLALAFALLLISLWIGERSGSQWDISIPVTTTGLLAHILLVHDLVEPTQINYVFWSIALEMQLYLLFPLLAAAWRRFGGAATAGAFCTVVYSVIGILLWLDFKDVPPQFLGLLAHFVLGMACAAAVRSQRATIAVLRDEAPWGSLCTVLLAVVAVQCIWWGPAVAEQRFAWLDALCAFATVALLLAAQRPQGICIRSVLEAPALLAVGVFSYSLYLVHAPLLQLVWQYGIQPLGIPEAGQFALLLVFAVPVCLVCAFIFFLGCERPFLRKFTAPVRSRQAPYPL